LAQELARSFGSTAADYDRLRPEWPAAAVARVADELALGDAAAVADVAAGTGKLTRRLRERFMNVTAVEPDERMRALLASSLPGVEVLAGTAEQLPLHDAAVDAVFVGDAFHWFDAATALGEFGRVVRRGGGLALLSNDWWDVEPPLAREAKELLWEPYARSGRAAAAAEEVDWETLFPTPAFGPLRADRIESELVLDSEELVALYLTTSAYAALPPAEREALAQKLRSLVSGRYTLPVTTQLYWSSRR